MGQLEISNVLERNYPKWMSYKDIMRETGTARESVMRSLKRMRKRSEVDIKVILQKDSRKNWINMYRSNGG